MKSNLYRMRAFILLMTAMFLTIGVTLAQDRELLSGDDMHGPEVLIPTEPEGASRAIGDDCTQPIVIPSIPFTDVNTTVGRLDNYDATCMGSYDGGEDIIYQFTIYSPFLVTAQLDPGPTTWTGIAIMDGCPQTGTCVALSTNSSASVHQAVGVLLPGTYYIMIDTYPSPDNIPQFTLNLTTAPAPPMFNAYGFSQSTGTYSEITGGVSLGTETSDSQYFVDPATPAGGTTSNGVGFPIGFNFLFNGTIFDRLGVNTNGWISLGQSTLTPGVNMQTSNSTTPLAGTSTATPSYLRSRISGFSRDLQAQVGATIRVETIGTAPNRVCVIQWKNYKRYGSSYTNVDNLNFQIRLYESTNEVKIMYGNFTTTSTTSTTGQVGIGGSLNSIYMARTSTTSWDNSVAATANNATMTLSNTVFPASGLTYVYSEIYPPLPALLSSPLNGSTGIPLEVVLNWAPDLSGGGTPTSYKVYMGTDNPPTNIVNGLDVGNVLSYDPTATLTTNTVYYWRIVPFNYIGDAQNTPVWSFTSTLGLGDLQGFTTNGFGIPLGGVTVNINNPGSGANYTTTSGPNGAYLFSMVTAGPYTLTASLPSYNTTVMQVNVAPYEVTYQNVVLTRPSMAVTPNPYSVTLNPNEMIDGAINITNNGDGTLGWSAAVNYTSPGPNTWLTLGANAGTVNPYTNFNVPVFFNASGLTSGTVKTAEIAFTSTPDVGTIVIPVTMTVTGVTLNVPTELQAVITDPIQGIVSLSWSFTPSGNFEYFVIKRDGAQIATTMANNYTDDLTSYGVYSYMVQAVFAEGNSAPAGPLVVEWANPTLVLDGVPLYNEQYPETSEEVTFTISNTGEGTLAYSFPEYLTRQLVSSPGFSNPRSTLKEANVAKGETDPTDGMGTRNLRGAGGPDEFGYVWIDSDEQGGPAYQWTDISGTGTLITGFTDDNVLGPYNIGFSFPFYENTYSQVYVSSNGYLVFGNTGSAYTNQNIPNSSSPNNLLAWFWNDLTGGGSVRYQNMGDRWIIQFNNYPDLSGTGTITAQVHLFPNGHIRIYYNNITSGMNITSSTVGIENSDGTIATNINYNSAYVHNGLAIAIDFPIPTFITAVNPAQGQVPAGESVEVIATFTSNNLDFPVGTHTAELELNTNDLAAEVVMIPATMVVYEPGMLTGTVTSAVDGSPIFGAMVIAGPYTAMTNEDGTYQIILDAGLYNLTFSKTGYTSVSVTGVVITETQTTVVDAELEELFYPPTLVHAVVNAADSQCDVTWGVPHPDYEILYDDGSAENYTAWALPGNMNAVKFTPAGYPATVYGGKIYVGDGSFPNNNTGFLGTTFGAMVFDDDGANGLPGTVLDSIEVTVNNYGWIEFNGLNATIEDGNFYLVMVQGGTSPNVAGVGVDQQNPIVYRSYSRNVVAGQGWGLSPFQDLMIRAFVSGPASDDDMANNLASSVVRNPLKQRGMISMYPPTADSGSEGQGLYLAVQNNEGSRDVTSYQIWRIYLADPDQGPSSGVFTSLNDDVATTNYTDAAFGPLPEGWYAYAVAANYTNGGQSEKAYSNIVGHKKLVDVTVNVSLTTGGSPAGALVTLTGHDYPYDVLSQTVPAEGQVIFVDVNKGPYTLMAQKVGFDDYIFDVNIQSDRTFDIILAEKKYMPRNLYVDDLTLVATWDEPLAIAVIENFEGATFPPAGWQALTQNTTGWYATTNGSSSSFVIPPHTKYAVTNDDAENGDGCCDYLITPEMNWSDLPTYRLNFASFYNGDYSQSAYVEISTDAGATWTVINTLSPAQSWQNLEVDLAAYSGATGLASVWLAFHADDNGEWASGWAIDDVQISSGGVPHQGYGVFLDGTLVGNTPETTWTYTNLNYGQEYLAGVAALFSSGYSELDTYRFTSRYLVPPDSLQGESPLLTDYVHLWWDAPGGGGGAGGSLFEDFEAGVLSEGWEIIQTNGNSQATPCYWTVNDYSSSDFVPFGVYHAGLWWDYSHQDEWLITPEINCGSSTVLTFETTVYEGSTNGDHYYVQISTDGGDTWTPVWDASDLTGNGWNYYDYNYTIDLSSFAGESIKVAFNAVDGDGQGLWYIWFVDNISIGNATDYVSFPATALTHISKGDNTHRSGIDQIARDGNTKRSSNVTRTLRAPAGLMGYNIYRHGEQVGYVAHPTLEYYDLNLEPGTYSYHITAVYDLTPYGFAGQTAESMIEGPIDVDVVYGYELPFTEDWTTGLFETNQWTATGGNWTIAGQTGNPAPAAEFSYNPVASTYEQAIESFYMIGSGYIDGNIKLDFDIKHTLVVPSETELLSVQVYNGNSWVQVKQYKNTESFDWTSESIDISNYAFGRVFRVRFVASGETTTNIFNWMIDNIHIYRECAPPTDLVASIPAPATHGDQILLEWTEPSGGGNVITAWLEWDNGENNDAIGLTGGGTFLVGVRFTPAQLAEYAGTNLTKIRMFPYADGGTVVLKVWTGANASQLVASQPVPSYVAGQWNEFSLSTPVPVTGTTELWFGYEVTHGSSNYVAGCDAGPAVAGYGDLLSLDGSVWESMSQAYGLDYNWNLGGYVESADGAVVALKPIPGNAIHNAVSALPVRGNLPPLGGTLPSDNSSRELVGYNIFRDGTFIANTTETEYLDTDPAISVFGEEYCYNVTAVYEDCESGYSNTACATIVNAPNVETRQINMYPNPSNSVVNIELTDNISTLVVYNCVGQIVNEITITKNKTIQLDVRNYQQGAYLVKFITDSGDSFARKIAVTK